MAHITREVAFAQNKPLQGFFARSNGPRQYAHLVIKTGQRNGGHAIRLFLRMGLHTLRGTALHRSGEPAERPGEAAAQHNRQHHCQRKTADGAEQ